MFTLSINFTSFSQVDCYDDVLIDNFYGFQPVQTVYQDDHPSTLDVNNLPIKVTQPLLAEKNILIFGVEGPFYPDGVNHKFIKFDLYNYWEGELDFKVKFQLYKEDPNPKFIRTLYEWADSEGNPFTIQGCINQTTGPCIPGKYVVNIEAPIPSNPFQINDPGNYLLRLEIVGRNGEFIDESNNENHIKDVKFEIIESKLLKIVLIPFSGDRNDDDDIRQLVTKMVEDKDLEKFLEGIFPFAPHKIKIEPYQFIGDPIWRGSYNNLRGAADQARNIVESTDKWNRGVLVVPIPGIQDIVDGEVKKLRGRAWGGNNTVVGLSVDPVNEASYPKVISHELAHSFHILRSHDRINVKEEYEEADGGAYPSRGYWVSFRDDNHVNGKWRDPTHGPKPPNTNFFRCIMGDGPLISTDPNRYGSYENQWIEKDHYDNIFYFANKNLKSRTKIQENVIAVSGKVADDYGRFNPFIKLSDNDFNQSNNDPGEYTILTFNQNGTQLNEFIFDISFFDHIDYFGTINIDTTSFFLKIPNSQDIQEFWLVKDDTVLDSFRVSDNIPVIMNLMPQDNINILPGVEISFTWEAEDIDGDEILFSAFYKSDSMDIWLPFSNGIYFSESSYVFDSKFFDQHIGTWFKVRGTDGFHITDSDSIRITYTSTGFKDEIILDDQIKCFPVPTSDNIHFKYEMGLSSPIIIRIFNQIGQQVGIINKIIFSSENDVIKWSTENLDTGLYFYEFSSGNIKASGKFINIK